MLTSDALLHFGGPAKLAEALGLTRTAPYQWGKHPPLLRQLQIEQMTSGRLTVSFPPTGAPHAARKTNSGTTRRRNRKREATARGG